MTFVAVQRDFPSKNTTGTLLHSDGVEAEKAKAVMVRRRGVRWE